MEQQTFESKMNRSHDNTVADPFNYFWDPIRIRDIVRTIRLFNRRGRVRILKIIRDNPGITNTGIQTKTRYTQSEVSQAIRDLMITGVIDGDRSGKYIHFEVNEHAMSQYQPLFEHIHAVIDVEKLNET